VKSPAGIARIRKSRPEIARSFSEASNGVPAAEEIKDAATEHDRQAKSRRARGAPRVGLILRCIGLVKHGVLAAD